MMSFNRKVALRIAAVSLALASIASPVAWMISRENAEESIVLFAAEESRRLLLHQQAFNLDDAQAQGNAQAAARTLAGGLFDISEIYKADGGKLAEELTDAGKVIEADIASHGPPSYQRPFYDSQHLSGDRWVLKVFIPLRKDNGALTGYFEGVRLIPAWQRDQIFSDALTTALMVALAALACGGILYPLVTRLAADNERKSREVLESHISMMEALGRAIARRDSDTGAHNYRVAWISATLAEALGVPSLRMKELIAGSFLHDVGKIGVPDAILLKPGKLSDEEMAVMRTHVTMGEEIVTGAGWLDGGRDVVAGHHEKWDGTGYPRGLAGEDIPFVARIFAIADVFDALCTKRPYKAPFTLEAALDTMWQGAGSHFDPHLLKVFADLAPRIYHTTINASEAEVKSLMERMVHKHFGL
jgi:HD-GYP domain-containing protein (c-di-GMP phosphodiesterase class II)